MDERFHGMSPHDLIARALVEDHAAIKATTEEACIAHHKLADLMRTTADRLLETRA